MGSAALRTVPVGPFRVADAPPERVVASAVELATTHPDRVVLVFALHVGGLNARRDGAFVAAMAQADVVYADGGSVVTLARIAGARTIERAPTTDVGWDVVRRVADARGRPARLVLVGGPEGLAERAATHFEASGAAEVVATFHGYRDDWAPVVDEIAALRPDVVVVGLGAPAEMLWATAWRDRLPPGIVLTCGGWFGHIVGDEKRAPRLIRRSGLEWIARVAQQPTRLGPRYARGVLSSAALVAPAYRRRRAAARGQ